MILFYHYAPRAIPNLLSIPSYLRALGRCIRSIYPELPPNGDLSLVRCSFSFFLLWARGLGLVFSFFLLPFRFSSRMHFPATRFSLPHALQERIAGCPFPGLPQRNYRPGRILFLSNWRAFSLHPYMRPFSGAFKRACGTNFPRSFLLFFIC